MTSPAISTGLMYADVCRSQVLVPSPQCLSVSPHQSLLLISTSLALITLLFPAEAEL